MARFVRTDRGIVNLDHVQTALGGQHRETIENGQSRVRDEWVTLYDKKGESLGRMSWANSDTIINAAAVIVPAYGAEAFSCHVWNGDGSRPTESDVYPESHVIAAWRITNGTTVEPLVADVDNEECGPFYIVMPNGKLGNGYDVPYESKADAMEQKLKEAQQDWDRKHATEQA